MPAALSRTVHKAVLQTCPQYWYCCNATNNCIAAAAGMSQLAAGRVAALHAMEQQLTSAAAANFPADAAVYT